MAKIHPAKMYLIERRNRLVWTLDHEGYSGGDIEEILKIDRSWVNRILKLKPRGWKPTIEKAP